jgi:alpha-L-fucosidase
MTFSCKPRHFAFFLMTVWLVCGCRTSPDQPVSAGVPNGRAAWMQQARWGVMTHYLADWRERTDGVPMSATNWNALVDHFDVDGLADQIKSTGAGYHILTIGQGSGYYDCPNPTYDRLTRIQPSKLSRRDLIMDMARALQKRGIKLIVYLPAGAPGGEPNAVRALDYQRGPNRNREFQIKWEAIIRDWSKSWGTNIAGWWFDGCYWPNAMYRSATPPNFASFAAAARAGNPNAVVAFNPGVVDRALSVTPYEDYTGGEINELDRAMIRRTGPEGYVDGAKVHFLSFLGATWGMGAPRFSTEQAVAYSRKITSQGGLMTWDTPVQKSGLISRPFLDQLTAIGQAVAGQTNQSNSIPTGQ